MTFNDPAEAHAELQLRRYSQRGNRRVEGWLAPLAVDMLMNVFAVQRDEHITGPVCEIGVHHGRLFILLVLATSPDELAVAYDLFDHQEQNIDASGCGSLEKLCHNLTTHGCGLSCVRACKINSALLTPSRVVDDCSARPRLFSIDGSHTPELTAHDLQVASESICDGGVIILDDVFNEPWPGVAEGTCRFMFREPNALVPFAIGGNKVLLTNSISAAVRYRESLNSLSTPARKSAQMFGHEVLVLTERTTSISRNAADTLRRSRCWSYLRTTRIAGFARTLRSRWPGV